MIDGRERREKDRRQERGRRKKKGGKKEERNTHKETERQRENISSLHHSSEDSKEVSSLEDWSLGRDRKFFNK